MTISQIFSTFSKLNPHPKTELEYTNNFTLLIAVVLSAQATDKRVNIITKDLFAKYDTPEKIVALGLEGLKTHIKSINYFNTKAKNIIALSQKLIDKYNSTVPSSLQDLTSLPGVGRKTANVVRACAFDIVAIPVDTHVLRVAHRLGIAHSKTPHQVEHELMANIPKEWQMHAHHWLVLHGRYICKARKPLCEECPVSRWCEYYSTHIQGKRAL